MKPMHALLLVVVAFTIGCQQSTSTTPIAAAIPEAKTEVKTEVETSGTKEVADDDRQEPVDALRYAKPGTVDPHGPE